MKREELAKLGLSDEQVDNVMKLHGKGIQDETALKEQLATLETERDGFKAQLADRDKDIKDLKKQSANSEEIQSKLSDLQSKYDNETKTLNDQLQATKLDSAITSALALSKARDPQDIRALLKSDDIKIGSDGALLGLDEQLKTLQESKAYLFTETPKTSGTNPQGGKSAAFTGDVTSAIKSNSVNLTEFIKQSNSNQGE
ncbi:phage scaffolding protein [Pseudolactococcus insecticola]|uniref:Scaffolding protein n=1 Tax=Pseudolactococcus insecticola TaxID=2709158 RepID=A0A6A0B4J2_9LACT|nr:phage scaffolding protein [Lactococcus insecticola]GFH39623.1 hypothetical protein Hs20B_00210 [Lactococcus insecticola]